MGRNASWKRGVAALLIGVAVITVASLPRIQAWISLKAEVRKAKAYQFPFAELVALDFDVQRRFAIPPKDNFGLYRIGPMHGMYQPHTWPEKQTLNALRKAGFEVAFYVVSERSLREDRGPHGLYPLQGPVHVTKPRREPQPRWSPFSAKYGITKEDYEKQKYFEKPEYFYPSGTPAPTSIPEASVPRPHELVLLAQVINRVAAEVPLSVPVRSGTELDEGWRVEATPIRASVKACVDCHQRWDWTKKREHKIGDTLGVALYVYRQQRAIESTPVKEKNES